MPRPGWQRQRCCSYSESGRAVLLGETQCNDVLIPAEPRTPLDVHRPSERVLPDPVYCLALLGKRPRQCVRIDRANPSRDQYRITAYCLIVPCRSPEAVWLAVSGRFSHFRSPALWLRGNAMPWACRDRPLRGIWGGLR